MGSLNRGSFLAKSMLMMIGGLAAMVAGFNGHYHADKQTPKKSKGKSRGRIGAGTYGKNLISHFNQKGICWSSKPNKRRAHYGSKFA